jgi:hypothetical protein
MEETYGLINWPTEYTRYEQFLEKVEDTLQWIYDRTINPFLDRQEQKVEVRIDRWDTWSVDHTLAHIILPLLIQLKRTKQGAPYVDPADVPKELRPTVKEKKAYDTDGTTDPNFFKRWDYVMDEMIFAFNSKLIDWEDQFYSGVHDLIFVDVGDGYSEIKSGPNDTFKWDKEGHIAYQERITNGFRLFGKYYESLWS